jgi:hypothetical protein
MLGKVKSYFLFKDLKSKESNFALKKTLSEAKTIGILALKSNSKEDKVLQDFIHELKSENKEITPLYFKKSNPEHDEKEVAIFNKKDLNWYNKPSKEKFKNFTDKKYDLIINFDATNFKPFHYIAAHTQGYKIAFNSAYNTLTYDFLIKCNNISVENLIKNLKLYLT